MNLFSCQCSETWNDVAKLILRVVLGAVLFMHGYQKIFQIGVGNVAEGLFTQMLNWPAPSLWAYLVSYGELIAGALLIVGLLTHWSGKISLIISIVALLAVHIKNGFFLQTGGYEYILLILAASVSVMVMGAGKYSVDEIIKSKSLNNTNS